MMVLLAGLGMGGCAQASEPVQLDCQTQGDTAKMLCQAVRDQLLQRGHQINQTAAVRLQLEASLPHPTRLLARLSVIQGETRRQGEQGELAVSDHDAIPHQQLDDFAAALIDRAGTRF